MRPLVSVIIVSFHSRDVLAACLESVSAPELEVIVVDNATGDGTADWVRANHPRVRIVDAGGNRGYGAGVNLGVTASRGESIFVLNPDSVVPMGAIGALRSALAAAPLAAVVAPALVDESGAIARSCGRFPGLWTLACEHLGIAARFPRTAGLCGSKLTRASLARATVVDWASGAALLIRRSAWEEIGPFDEAIFLYMEEVDWCRRARAHGWETRYVPGARIVHLGQRSSRQAPTASYLHNLRSRIHYMAKHHGNAAGQATRTILALSMAIKWVVARLSPGGAASAATYGAGLIAVLPRPAASGRVAALLLAAAALALGLLGGGQQGRPAFDGAAHAATGSLASSPQAGGPSRLGYFYEYMPYDHLDSLAWAGFDGAVIHSIDDSTNAVRVAGFRARGRLLGIEVVPQWAIQQAKRLATLGTTRRYTWGAGRIEPAIACPLDAAYWKSALLDRAEEVLAADPSTRAIAVDLEFHQGSLHHYDAGPCRCAACLAEYLGPSAGGGAVDPARLRGLLGWEEARVAEIVGALADTLAARHPGIEIGVFDLDYDSFVHRGVARALAASGLPVADYCERSYSTGASALGVARARLDALGLARARLIGGIWLKRFDPDSAARAASEIRAIADGTFVFTTFSLWLDPRELTGPYTLGGAPGDYWRAFREGRFAP